MSLSRVAAGLGPVKGMGPLRVIVAGFDAQRMPTYQEALKEVADAGYINDLLLSSSCIYEQAEDARNFGDLVGDPLPIENVAAIMMYSAEATAPPFYQDMNSKCYAPDRTVARPYAKYLWLFHHSLKLIPPYAGRTIYRGVRVNLKDQYIKDRKLTWHSPSSCTTSIEVLSNPMFLGTTGPRTIFVIELTQYQAREITQYSLIASENEVILPAGTRLQVISVLEAGGDLIIVTLRELESMELLLDLSAPPASASPAVGPPAPTDAAHVAAPPAEPAAASEPTPQTCGPDEQLLCEEDSHGGHAERFLVAVRQWKGPSALRVVKLLNSDTKADNKWAIEVAKALPQTLLVLHLQLNSSQVTGPGLTAIVESLPPTLQELHLNFDFVIYTMFPLNEGLELLSARLPPALVRLHVSAKVGFPGQKAARASAMAKLEAAAQSQGISDWVLRC